MTAQVLLALLAFGLTAAQQEFVMYTNGTGGVECGKYHRCITNATCENKEGIHMCECIPELVGNAKIHCLPKEDNNVWIQNDPHIKNFHKEFASLLTPCPYRVLKLVFLDEEKRIGAKVSLFGENLLFKGGEYYLAKLTLNVTVYLGEDVMKQVMAFYGDVHDNGYSYKLVAKSLHTDISSKEEGSTVSFEEGPFMGYTMDVEKDDCNNLLTVKIKSLGISLLFRPPSLDKMLDNKILPMVPGAVFNVDKEHWKFLDLNVSQYDIASWPLGPSLKDKATELNMSKPLFVQYLMLNNFVDIGYYNGSVCVENNRIFNEICRDEEIKVDTLRVCSSLYTEKTFLRCLSNKGNKDYIEVHKKVFQKCELSLCMKNVTECEIMKKEISVLTGCPPPKKIQELDCSTINNFRDQFQEGGS